MAATLQHCYFLCKRVCAWDIPHSFLSYTPLPLPVVEFIDSKKLSAPSYRRMIIMVSLLALTKDYTGTWWVNKAVRRSKTPASCFQVAAAVRFSNSAMPVVHTYASATE